MKAFEQPYQLHKEEQGSPFAADFYHLERNNRQNVPQEVIAEVVACDLKEVRDDHSAFVLEGQEEIEDNIDCEDDLH